MSTLEDGQRYPARPTGAASVYENDNGNLICCMEIEVEGQHLRFYSALATAKDGVNSKNIDRLKQMFGWDGLDPFWFVDHGADYADCEVEATIEMRPGTTSPDKWFPSIKYLDPLGGGGGALPSSSDRNSLLAKYGSKFRAVAGGVPAAPKSPPSKPAVKPPPSSPPGKTSDQLTVWEKYVELGGKESNWFKTLEEAVPGVDQGDLTPSQWGKVLEHIETVSLPM